MTPLARLAVDLGGVRTIFRKRQDGTSTFVLVENGEKFQIVISLANGKAALGQIRTNDFFALSFAWEFREFHLDATSGMLVPAPVAQTPDRSFNFSDRLGRFVLRQ